MWQNLKPSARFERMQTEVPYFSIFPPSLIEIETCEDEGKSSFIKFKPHQISSHSLIEYPIYRNFHSIEGELEWGRITKVLSL